MKVAGIVAVALIGAAAGTALELVVARVPTRAAVLAGPTFGAGGIEWRPRTVVLATLTAASSVGMALRFGATWVLVAYLVFAAGCVALTVVDLQTYLLPDRIVGPLAVAGIALLGVAALAETTWSSLGRGFLGGVVLSAAFGLAHLVSPRALGFGDVKFAFVLGMFLAWLGWGELVLGVFCGFLSGAIVGVALVLSGRRGRRDPLPFGPFLVVGAMTAIWWGRPILDWYRAA